MEFKGTHFWRGRGKPRGEPEGDRGPDVGTLLRASRIRIGEEVEDVAHALRIRQSYIIALEEGRLDEVPGLTYAVGFVRSYAEHVGLDSEDAVRRFKEETADVEPGAELVFPSPVSEGGVPGGAIILGGLLLAGLAYGGWYVLSVQDKTLAELIPPVPERLMSFLSDNLERIGYGEATDSESAIAVSDIPDSAANSPVTADVLPPSATEPALPTPSEDVSDSTAAVVETEAPPTPAPSPTEVMDSTPAAAATPPSPPTPVETISAETVPQPSAPLAAPVSEVLTAALPPDVPAPAERAPPPPVPASEIQPAAVPAVPPAPAPAASAPPPAAPEIAAPTQSVPTEEPLQQAETDVEAETAPPPPESPLAVQSVNSDVPRQNEDLAADSVPDVTPTSVPGLARAPEEDLLPPPEAIPQPPAADRVDRDASREDRQVAGLVENTDVPPAEIVPPAGVGQPQIVVRAKTDSWIQVRDDIGNRLLMTRLMRAGDEYVVPDRPGLKLLTGNAGALEILVDGKLAPSLGPIGAVRRNVSLQPDLLLAGTAAAQ